MDRDLIRLECLKLANVKNMDTNRVLDIAAQYETFVAGTETKPNEIETPKVVSKKLDKPKDLFGT